QERVERTQGRAEVAKTFHACADSERDVRKTQRIVFSKDIPELESVIAFRRFSKLREFAVAPVVVSSIDDDTANRVSVSTDPLRCGFYYNVRSVFNRTEEIAGGTKGVVYNQR